MLIGRLLGLDAGDFRIFVVRSFLAGMWIGFVSFAVASTVRADGFHSVYGHLMAAGVLLVLLSVVPWQSLLGTRRGDIALLALYLLTSAGMVAAVQLGLGVVSAIAAVTIAVASAMTLAPPLGYLPVIAAAAAHPAALVLGGFEISIGILTETVVILGLGFAAARVADELDTLIRQEAFRARQVREQETRLTTSRLELERVNAVMRSIGEGYGLDEVLPALLRRVCDTVSARTAMIFVYAAESQGLQLLNPIWHHNAISFDEDRSLSLTESGLPQRVYIEGQVEVHNRLESETETEWGRIVDHLDLPNAVVLPLKVHDKEVGVLVVADKLTGVFSDHDQHLLSSLAAPTSLVVDQVVNYAAAKDETSRMTELANLKSDFVSVVSHELRTPLTSMIGALQTLLRPELLPPDPKAQSLVNSALNQSNRLRSMIEDLLVASRIDNRAIPVRMDQIDLAVTVGEAVDTIEGSAGRVHVDIPSDLGDVTLDPSLLSRCVINLTENAMKYSGDSPIEITGAIFGGEVVLTIADHGPGLPFEMRNEIFDRFRQLGRTEVQGRGGIGLGLAIVRGLTESMGGKISYEPTVGGGATFKLRFPVEPRAHRMTATMDEHPVVEVSTPNPAPIGF